MASCEFHRLDSLNTSDGSIGKWPSRLIWDDTTDEIMVGWWDSGHTPGGTGGFHFARFDPATNTPNSEVVIDDFAFSSQVGAFDMVRLTSGRLVAVWYSAATVAPGGGNSSFSVSNDGGATWSAAANFSDINDRPIGIATDGTDVWVLCVGLGSQDVSSYKYTAASSTFGASTKIYNSGGGGGTPGPWDNSQIAQAHTAMHMTSALVGFCVGWCSTDATSDGKKLSCLYTTDGWATATKVVLTTYTTGGGGGAVNLTVLDSGRCYVVSHNPNDSSRITFHYTDNIGVAWTTVGIPTVYDTWLDSKGVNGDNSYDSFVCLDSRENLIFGQSTQQIINPGYHGAFRSVEDPAALADWVQVGECSYSTTVDTLPSAMAGRGIIVGSDLYRLVTVNRTGTLGGYTLEFLTVEGAGIPEEPPEPPSPPPAIESGADDNNMLMRLDMADGRGFSIHAHAVSCFLPWDEGDEETGREVFVMLTGSPSMDPGIQDPDLLTAFWRIETGPNDGYGKRFYVAESSDVQSVRYDPFRTVVRTKEFTITGDFDKNVCRGICLQYRRAGLLPLPVTVLIDGKTNSVIEFPPSTMEVISTFKPLKTTNNVGTSIQFMVDVTDLDPWAVNAFGLKYMRKKIRGMP